MLIIDCLARVINIFCTTSSLIVCIIVNNYCRLKIHEHGTKPDEKVRTRSFTDFEAIMTRNKAIFPWFKWCDGIFRHGEWTARKLHKKIYKKRDRIEETDGSRRDPWCVSGRVQHGFPRNSSLLSLIILLVFSRLSLIVTCYNRLWTTWALCASRIIDFESYFACETTTCSSCFWLLASSTFAMFKWRSNLNSLFPVTFLVVIRARHPPSFHAPSSPPSIHPFLFQPILERVLCSRTTLFGNPSSRASHCFFIIAFLIE